MTYLLALPLLFAQAAPAAPPVDAAPPPVEQQAAPENSPASAPAETGTTEADDAAGESGLWDTLAKVADSGAMKYMVDGGLFMWPILLLGIVACGVILERYRSLKMLAADPADLRAKVRDLLQQDRPEEALELCERETGPVAAILSAGLRKYVVLRRLGYDTARVEEQVVKAMDDYSVHVVAALEKHLPILATVSSAAPMVGFLGTVAGMVISFDEIKNRLGEENIVLLAADGISVALLTTCFGLIVGIPAYVAFNYYNGVINRFVLEVEQSATELIETVSLHETLSRRNGEVHELEGDKVQEGQSRRAGVT
jgi:biopolymer transport protein ExbB